MAYRELVAKVQYATLLDRLVHEGLWTSDEVCAEFEKKARELGVASTLSPRQLARWRRGEVGLPRKGARRVAEAFWGYSFDELVRTPTEVLAPEPTAVSTQGPRPDSVSLEAAALMAAHESFEHAARIAGSVETTDISMLQTAVRELARNYQATPPAHMLTEARHVRDVAYVLLDRTRRPDQTTDLYLTAAVACGLLAVASFDLSSWRAAEEQARAAHTYADLIGHSDLAVWARGTQALIANWRQQPRRAVELVAMAQADAAPGAATARLRAIEARAWATIGSPDQVNATLRLADEAMDLHRGGTDLYDEGGGEFGWGRARHAACAGTALLTVGAAEPAVARLEEAIEQLPNDPYGGQGTGPAHVDLAIAELSAGRLDASIDALEVVWAIPASQRRQTITGRLDQLVHHLTTPAWRQVPAAAALRDQIEDYTIESASRLALRSAEG